MTIDSFKREIAAATRTYDQHVVCLGKTPDEFETSLRSLFSKAFIIGVIQSTPAGTVAARALATSRGFLVLIFSFKEGFLKE